MLTADDIGVVLAAVEDPSPEVRRSAERLLVLLLPLVDDSLIQQYVSGLEKKPVKERFDRARELHSNQEQSGSAETEFGFGFGYSEPDSDEERSRLVERFGRAEGLESLFYIAAELMKLGTCDYFEQVLDEIESGPLEAAKLEWPMHFDMRRFECKERMLRVASDTKRRGDVRYIAWLFGRVSRDEIPPELPDLRLLAEQELESCFNGPSVTLPRYSQVLRFVDPERAMILVIKLFEDCLSMSFRDQWYMDGNEIVTLVAKWGRSFIPDISALFEVYFRAFETCQEAREEWYQTRDDYIVWDPRGGFLALAWQIAWTAGRVSLPDVIFALAPFLTSLDLVERLAALAFMEDAIRYSHEPPPLFGGVSAPDMGDEALIEQLKSATTVAAQEGYTRVNVFYGTNRKATGSQEPSQWYGCEDGSLQLGMCEVTVPLAPMHKTGSLESPPNYALIRRLDPKRYVLLSKIEPLSQGEFCQNLQSAVNSSHSKHALVFVHGYRVRFEDAARRTAQLAHDLRIDIPLFFSWPTRGKLLAYQADETMALRSKRELLQFLNLLADHSGAEVIHLIAHSMGALALCGPLVEFLDGRTRKRKPVFREIILAAPDIDEQIFRDQIVPKMVNKGPQLTLYASRRDYALLSSGHLRFGLLRAGMVVRGKPLVVMRGVETIDVSAVNSEAALGALQGHSYFGESSPVVQDIFELVSGKRARDRFGMIEASLGGVPYWIMEPRGT